MSASRMPDSPMEGTARKRAIIRAAQRLFARHGYARTTIRMISREAQVAFGLVAHHFGNKENVFLAAGAALIDEVLAFIRARSPEVATGAKALECFVGLYFTFTQEHRDIFPTLIRCSPFSDDNPGLDRQRIGRKFQELIAEIESLVRRGQADGSLMVDADPHAMALFVYAAMVGAVRTVFLAGFADATFFDAARSFILRAAGAREDT
ncbi:MAG: TetR/AcrR family transcriptional regulator [Desulfomicrobiaceae bacterium]